MNVLCIAAHPDDEVLGVGGTLARHVTEGHDVHVCILSDGVSSRYNDKEAAHDEIQHRQNCARRACKTLGATVSLHQFPDNCFDTVPLLDIVQTIETEIEKHAPDVVYTHHDGDLNIDHELTCRAATTAARPLKTTRIRRVLAFETLSSTEWSTPSPQNRFLPHHFVSITDQLDTKISALKEYKEELRKPPHPRTVGTVRQNAEVWGAKVGVDAAEPFRVIREVR